MIRPAAAFRVMSLREARKGIVDLRGRPPSTDHSDGCARTGEGAQELTNVQVMSRIAEVASSSMTPGLIMAVTQAWLISGPPIFAGLDGVGRAVACEEDP